MISEIWNCIRYGEWFEKIIGTIMALFIAFVILLIGYGIFVAVDSWFMPYSTAGGSVVSKNYSPGYFQTTYISNGNGGSTMVMTWIPDSWHIKVQIEKGSDWIEVNEAAFNGFQSGTNVTVDFQNGRISDEVYMANPRRSYPESP